MREHESAGCAGKAERGKAQAVMSRHMAILMHFFSGLPDA